MTFEQFNLQASILKSIKEKGFINPTPVQEQVIPLMTSGKDVMAYAQTGTGKTLAFLLPILSSLSSNRNLRGIKALILVPTRELALQIAGEIEQLTRNTYLRHAVIIGGDSVEQQLSDIKYGADIVVATPGRLLHFESQRLVSLRDVEWFVIDEGDRMLDMGFIGSIRKIASSLPRKCRSSLFSATLRDDTIKLAKTILYRPATVSLIENKPDLSLITQVVYYVDKPNKLNLLLHILKEDKIINALIFVRTKNDADALCEQLISLGYKAVALHGNKEQNERSRAFLDFLEGKAELLISTDLAARGIDAKDLDYVFNYELPSEPETYIHRIGRTGRANKSGCAISLVSNAELRFLKSIKKIVGAKDINIIEKLLYSYPPRKNKSNDNQ